MESEWGGQCLWSYGSSHSAVTAILFHPEFNVKILSFYHDFEGRIVLALCNINNKTFIFTYILVYCPNDELMRNKFLIKLRRHLTGPYIHILGGDFNFVESLQLDKVGGNPNLGNTGKKQLGVIKGEFDFFCSVMLHSFLSRWRPRNPLATDRGAKVSCTVLHTEESTKRRGVPASNSFWKASRTDWWSLHKHRDQKQRIQKPWTQDVLQNLMEVDQQGRGLRDCFPGDL